MTNMSEPAPTRRWLVRVVQPHAVFGLVVFDGLIIEAAPIAAWAVGRRGRQVVRYFRDRGAEVQFIPIEDAV